MALKVSTEAQLDCFEWAFVENNAALRGDAGFRDLCKLTNLLLQAFTLDHWSVQFSSRRRMVAWEACNAVPRRPVTWLPNVAKVHRSSPGR